MRVFEIGEVVAHARGLLQRDPLLSDLWVRGEIASVTYARSGHVYFCLRDGSNQLDCVMFRRAAQFLSTRLEPGQAVVAHGAVDLYEARSLVQLYADLVEQEGVGLWRLQFELLCRRLEAEGLFAPARKRPLPAFPRRIGLATSSTGAVRHDIARVLARRYPLAELVLADCAVQGEHAPGEIVAALQRLNRFAAGRLPATRRAEAIDVIILARGGGAPEELAVFSDEGVARAIFASAIPVISAIGHETDYTVADLVADVRAPTPSVAAELVAPDVRTLRETLADHRRRLAAAAASVVQDHRHALDALDRQLQWRSPQALLVRHRQRVDELTAQLRWHVQQQLTTRASRLDARRLQLLALSPTTTLARGYALCHDARGRLVTAAAQLSPGDGMAVRLHDGLVHGKVEASEPAPIASNGAQAAHDGVPDEYESTIV